MKIATVLNKKPNNTVVYGFFAATALASAILTACGGGASSKSFSASAALGAVSGATCTAKDPATGNVYAAKKDANGDPVKTDASGSIDFTGLPANVGTLIVSCKGGDYYDEATGTVKTLSPTDEIKSVLPKGASSVGVTPLTSLVAARVEQALVGQPAGSTVSAEQVALVVGQIAAVFAPGVDLLAPPAVINGQPGKTADDITAGSAAGKYAAALAGLSQLAAGKTGGNQITLLQALVSDLSDGIIGDDLGSSLQINSIGALNTALDQAVSDATSPEVAQASTADSPRSTQGNVSQPEVKQEGGTGGTGGSN